MIRRAFLKRMAMAAVASGLLGTELLRRREPEWECVRGYVSETGDRWVSTFAANEDNEPFSRVVVTWRGGEVDVGVPRGRALFVNDPTISTGGDARAFAYAMLRELS
jgi:hypothetical protein